MMKGYKVRGGFQKYKIKQEKKQGVDMEIHVEKKAHNFLILYLNSKIKDL